MSEKIKKEKYTKQLITRFNKEFECKPTVVAYGTTNNPFKPIYNCEACEHVCKYKKEI